MHPIRAERSYTSVMHAHTDLTSRRFPPRSVQRLVQRKRLLASTFAVLIVASAYIAADLLVPRPHSLRKFDPGEVARLDTIMWRSYYDKQRLALFRQAAELLRTQYGMRPIRSYVVAAYAAKSAFDFKGGTNRAEYERALPDLVRFFESIKRDGDIDFDVREAARLELEWWIVHRQRDDHPPGDLARALAEAAAAVYGVPPADCLRYGQLRAEAMEIRDSKAEAGGVTEDDWNRIGGLLDESWRSLHAVVAAR